MSLPGCSLVTWAFGEGRSPAGTTAASTPVTPASPLPAGDSAAPASPPTPAAPAATAAAAPAGSSTGPGATPGTATAAAVPSPAGGAAQATSSPSGPAAAPGRAATPGSATGPTAATAPGTASSPRPAAAGRAEPGAAGGRYTVQVGAFRNPAAAQAVRGQLAGELERAPALASLVATLRVVEQAGLHRVWVGGAASAREARALASRIREATGREVIVARP